jgi:chemotaxis protein MotB
MLLARVTALEPFRAALMEQVRGSIGQEPGVVLTDDSIVLETDGMFNQRRAEITLTDTGEARLRAVAQALAGVAAQIPPDFPWLLRVEGHTDDLQLKPRSAFRSNWELSAERATVVAEYLRGQRVPGDRLGVAAFAQYRPLDTSGTAESRARNRRIELRLAER